MPSESDKKRGPYRSPRMAAAEEYQRMSKATYAAIVTGKDTTTALPLKQLCLGRNHIATAMMVISGVLKAYHPQVSKHHKSTYAALRQINVQIERSYLKYPLRIE